MSIVVVVVETATDYYYYYGHLKAIAAQVNRQTQTKASKQTNKLGFKPNRRMEMVANGSGVAFFTANATCKLLASNASETNQNKRPNQNKLLSCIIGIKLNDDNNGLL